jgi:hypothetical protein
MTPFGARRTFAKRPASARCWLAASILNNVRRRSKAKCLLVAHWRFKSALLLHHFRGKQDSRACGSDRCDSVSSDVVGLSVCRCAYRKRKATQQLNAAIEAHQFHRDLAVIMIHSQHCVECAAFGAQKHCICRKWAFCRDPVSDGFFRRKSDSVNLFPPEISAIARRGD